MDLTAKASLAVFLASTPAITEFILIFFMAPLHDLILI